MHLEKLSSAQYVNDRNRTLVYGLCDIQPTPFGKRRPMKIDFLGSFKTIQRSLHQEPSNEKKDISNVKTPFARLIDEQIKPKYADQKSKLSVKIRPKILPTVPPEAEIADVMAQISSKLVTPKLNPPELSNSRLEPLNLEDVNKPLPALTPPTIVSIKRHDSADVFDRLPRNERVAAVGNLIGRANEIHGTSLPVPLGLAVVSTESSFRAKSISRDGHATKGLFQFLDSTGREILSRSDSSTDYRPLNPEQNVSLGVRYLTHLQDIFSRPTKLTNGLETIPATTTLSNKKIALAAFNAGEGRLASAQARALREQLNPGDYDDVKLFIPASTRRYVESVLKQEQEFQLAINSRAE